MFLAPHLVLVWYHSYLAPHPLPSWIRWRAHILPLSTICSYPKPQCKVIGNWHKSIYIKNSELTLDNFSTHTKVMVELQYTIHVHWKVRVGLLTGVVNSHLSCLPLAAWDSCELTTPVSSPTLTFHGHSLYIVSTMHDKLGLESETMF